MDKGIHPVKVADGFEQACKVAVEYLSQVATTIDFSEENIEPLVEVALTTLSSKIVNKFGFIHFLFPDSNVKWLKLQFVLF